MPQNIEIKARIESVEDMLPVATALGSSAAQYVTQDDTFFQCPDGRLKLRVTDDGEGTLIFYRRPDQYGPKASSYVHTSTTDPHELREVLSEAYGELGRVRKSRIALRVGHARVHLDVVEGLGHFLELEVDVRASEQDAVEEAHALMAALAIADADLVQGSYLDLLQDTARQES